MSEEFRYIPEFPRYRVSNLGRVQSVWSGSWKDLHPSYDKKGYAGLTLCNLDKSHKKVRVHNLVAKAFIGERPFGQVVRHLDGDSEKNWSGNLQYGTHRENEHDKKSHGTWNTRNGGAKLSVAEVEQIRELSISGETDRVLAAKFRVSRPTINRINNHKIWKKCV